MYVCICAATSETELREYIEDGARTVEEVGEMCGAGTNCGGCVDTIDVFIAAAVSPSELSQLPMTA